MTRMDDQGFNRALNIIGASVFFSLFPFYITADSLSIQTSGAPIHFLVMRKMECVILGEPECLNYSANLKPANCPANPKSPNHPFNPKPAIPARFGFSAALKVRVFLFSQSSFFTIFLF